MDRGKQNIARIIAAMHIEGVPKDAVQSTASRSFLALSVWQILFRMGSYDSFTISLAEILIKRLASSGVSDCNTRSSSRGFVINISFPQ